MLHLVRALLLADVVTPDALAEALLLAATQRTSLTRGLIAAHAIDAPRLEAFLDQFLEGAPAPLLLRVVPLRELALRLPAGLCERLQAVPVRRDPITGMVDVAVVDSRDTHATREIAHFLQAPVRMVRTSLASMEAALVEIHAERARGIRSLAPPMGFGPPRETPVEAAPAPHDPELAIPLTRRNPGSIAAFPAAAVAMLAPPPVAHVAPPPPAPPAPPARPAAARPQPPVVSRPPVPSMAASPERLRRSRRTCRSWCPSRSRSSI